MPRARLPLEDLAIFLVLSLLWGTTWAAIRIALQGLPPFGGAAVRFAVAGGVLLAVARWRSLPLGRNPHERRLWVVQTLTTFAGSYGVVYWAEQWVPSSMAAVLFATFPLWALALGRWMLPSSPVRPREIWGAGLGLAGVGILFGEDLESLAGGGAGVAGLVMLAAPMLSALGSVMTKRWGRDLSPLSLTSVPMLATGGLLGVLSTLLERDRPWGSAWEPWVATLYLALAGSALTFTLYFRLLARRSLFVASSLSYTVPLVALLVGVRFLGEPMSVRLATGSALIVVGVALGALGSARGEERSVLEPDG